MSDHLRFSGASHQVQVETVKAIIRRQPVLMTILERLRDMALPDPLLGSGAIYNSVWNELTGKPPLTGIKDADVVYFDDSDLSYEAEDRVIRRAAEVFGDLPLPVEVRNQARVHLWFPQKFGTPYPQLRSSAEMMDYFASKTHAVSARLEDDDAISVFAPFGLDDVFSFRITPNTALDNRNTHHAKAERNKGIWPELTVVPWPE